MTDNTIEVLEFIKKDLEDLSISDQKLIEIFENKGYLDSPEIFTYNRYLITFFCGFIKGDKSDTFFINFLNSTMNEISFMGCLVSEWFVAESFPIGNYFANGNIQIDLIEETWKNKYSKTFKTLTLFDDFNSDYFENHTGLYRKILYNLFQNCGVKETYIDQFFEKDFQRFRDFLINLAMAFESSDFKRAFEYLNSRYELTSEQIEVITRDDFNAQVNLHESSFIEIFNDLFYHFDLIRQCTLSVLQSHLELLQINTNASLCGAPSISVQGFEELNKLVNDLLSDSTINLPATVKAQYNKFLNQDFDHIDKPSGFIILMNRQSVFVASLSAGPTIFASEQAIQNYVSSHNQDMADLATLNRLKFIIEKRCLFSEEEHALFVLKLSQILTSNNITFYSDIFELYFIVLMKNSGISIELMTSQKKGGNEISTCDYKIGKNIGADCKCLIGGSITINSLPEHFSKVGKQVNSTVGFQNITFGGAIIGLRDKEFGFLEACRKYKGDDKYELNERCFLTALFLEIYSEFRRHTDSAQKFVKFIVVYYLPGTDITVEEALVVEPDSITKRNEIMAVFTTKYATDAEVKSVGEEFKNVCNFIFKFNNAI